MVPDPRGGSNTHFLGHLGPVLTRFRLFWPILAQFLPGLESVMEYNMGPKPVKTQFFQKWPQTLWEAQTDLSGPVLCLYQELDIGYWCTRQRSGGDSPPPTPVPPFQYVKRAKPSMGPKSVKSEVFQKWPRILWESGTDLKRIQHKVIYLTSHKPSPFKQLGPNINPGRHY